MRLISKYKTIINEKEGMLFNYRHDSFELRIFIISNEKMFTWEISINLSSYIEQYKIIHSDYNTFHKTVYSAKKAAYKILKIEVA